jgi:hypothetical protein
MELSFDRVAVTYRCDIGSGSGNAPRPILPTATRCSSEAVPPTPLAPSSHSGTVPRRLRADRILAPVGEKNPPHRALTIAVLLSSPRAPALSRTHQSRASQYKTLDGKRESATNHPDRFWLAINSGSALTLRYPRFLLFKSCSQQNKPSNSACPGQVRCPYYKPKIDAVP